MTIFAVIKVAYLQTGWWEICHTFTAVVSCEGVRVKKGQQLWRSGPTPPLLLSRTRVSPNCQPATLAPLAEEMVGETPSRK